MTYLQMLTRLAIRRGATSGTLVAATKTRYGNSLNEAQKKLLRKPGMEDLRRGPFTFASVANQKLYAFPDPAIARVNWITEATNDRRLLYRTPDWLDSVDPDPQSGTPGFRIPRGTAEAHTQPSNASEVFIKSTAAGDTGTAYIEGYITGGYYRTANVTMTGVTAVSLSTSITSWIQITKVYLSAAAAGTVTLHEDSGSGAELSRITIARARARFWIEQLYPTPGGVITYTADVLRAVPDMTIDTDEPLVPDDFHDLLIDMAELAELRKQDDPHRFSLLTGDVRTGTNEFISFVQNHPDWRPHMTGSTDVLTPRRQWSPVVS